MSSEKLNKWYTYNICKIYLFYEKLSKIMQIVTIHKNSHNQKYNKTCIMVSQSLYPLLRKEILSGLRELEIPIKGKLWF